MKSLLPTFLAAALLSSCVGPGDPGPPQTIAPRVAILPEVPSPTTDVVTPLLRQQAREMDRVRGDNERLKEVLNAGEEHAAVIADVLQRALAAGQADKAKLQEIDSLFQEERSTSEELQRIVDAQGFKLSKLQFESVTLETAMADLRETVAVSNQQHTNRKVLLGTANIRITELADAKNKAVLNAGEWKEKADTADGRIAAERKWKWIGWGVAGVLGLLFYVSRKFSWLG